MSRSRQLLLSGILTAGIGTMALVFVLEGPSYRSPWLSEAAGIASFIVCMAFAVRFATVFRSQSSSLPNTDSTRRTHAMPLRWREWGLGAWLAICIAAFVSEMLGRGLGDPGRLLPPVGTILLVGIFAIQAFRMVTIDRRLRNP